MCAHELAGEAAPHELLINVPRLIAAYYTVHPDPANPAQRVSVGTPGRRGVSRECRRNGGRIVGSCRGSAGDRAPRYIHGPRFVARATRAHSEPALRTAVEVF